MPQGRDFNKDIRPQASNINRRVKDLQYVQKVRWSADVDVKEATTSE